LQGQSDVVEVKRKQRDNLLRRAPAAIADNYLKMGNAGGTESMKAKLEGELQTAQSAIGMIDAKIAAIAPLTSDELIRQAANDELAGG
ncbi:hypothetical protein U2088_15555, partial [Listeria monocytogenes]|uniref:hypothetical protein n=1 Tax=Listeria monocytogenes TaxID=1639 RepID=UPI002FDC4214